MGRRGDVVAVEVDAATVGLDEAGDHVEHRGLAGAVGTEQADRLAAPDIEADASHDLAAGKALLDAVDREIIAGSAGAPRRVARGLGRACARAPPVPFGLARLANRRT